MITIVNLTPHPVTIIRPLTEGDLVHLANLGLTPHGDRWRRSAGYALDRIAADSGLHVSEVDAETVSISRRTEYPACAPSDLPRATESAEYPAAIDPNPGQPGARRINIGDMALSDSGSDGQGGYENFVTLSKLGIVDFVGYTGVDRLPDFAPGEQMFGLTRFYVVSIVTAIGALAAGRGIEDLLVPMGQVRDDKGRIVGATGLAPATSLLTPMYRAIVGPYQKQIIEALRERNEARRAAPPPPPPTA